MAIDTANKRASAIHVSMPWRGMLPLPDGSLNQADRQQTDLMYRGILASGAPVVVTVQNQILFISNVGTLMNR